MISQAKLGKGDISKVTRKKSILVANAIKIKVRELKPKHQIAEKSIRALEDYLLRVIEMSLTFVTEAKRKKIMPQDIKSSIRVLRATDPKEDQ